MSTDFEVLRLKIDNFRPKSENTNTSLSFAPNEMKVAFVTDTGCAMVAANLESAVEYTRI